MIIGNAVIREDTLKCRTYDETIKQIKKAFKELGFSLQTQGFRKNPKLHCYSYSIRIPELNVRTFGKGSTKKQAFASALGEIAERFSGHYSFKFFFPDYNQITDREILQFINGEHLPGYIHAQQDDLTNCIKMQDLFRNYHKSFSSKQIAELSQLDISQHWVDGYSIFKEKIVKVPLRLIKIINATNGLASGNTLEEAIVQATCEIFERYCQITVFRNKIIVPTIDKSTIQNKLIHTMIEQFEKCGIEIILKDFSLGNLFPVVGVLFINSSIQDPASINYLYEHFRISNGSSFNIAEAIIRCFTENFSLISLDRNNKGFTKRTEELIKKLEKNVFIETTTYRGLFQRGLFAGDKTFLLQGEKSSCPTFPKSNNFLDYISQIKTMCQKLNTDFIVVDHTHPFLRFPTVRVIMPGFSDILNYFNRDFENMKNYLTYGVPNDTIKQRYSSEFNIFTKENLQALEENLLYTIVNNGDSELEHVSNELNSAKSSYLLLASIYFHRGEYHKFIIMAEKISKTFVGSLRRKYKYLELLTKFYLKTKNEDYQTILIEAYQKMIGCHRYLVNVKSNPYITWCDQPCEKDCEKKYRQALKKALTSFFVPKQSSSTMTPLDGL